MARGEVIKPYARSSALLSGGNKTETERISVNNPP
jgi:hypothetical protein